jgi:hypothetical protein
MPSDWLQQRHDFDPATHLIPPNGSSAHHADSRETSVVHFSQCSLQRSSFQRIKPGDVGAQPLGQAEPATAAAAPLLVDYNLPASMVVGGSTHVLACGCQHLHTSWATFMH